MRVVTITNARPLAVAASQPFGLGVWLTAAGLHCGCLLLYRAEERCPVRAERARALALQTFSQGVDVDAGLCYGRDGPLRRRVVRLEAVVQAAAFTLGQHIVFGSGQYPPHSRQGWDLLRHELVHTIQQPSTEAAPNLPRTEPGDPFEVEADQVGRVPGAGWPPVRRSASPVLARQPTPGASHPATTSYRPISITIGGTPVGRAVTFSYPVDNDEYYVVPLYNVTVAGTDAAGKTVTTTFKALRFGVYYDPGNPVGASKSAGPFVAGRASHQAYTAGFRSDYEVHSADSPEPMAWDLNGGFLIHDGPDYPVDPAKFDPAAQGNPADPSAAVNNLYARSAASR